LNADDIVKYYVVHPMVNSQGRSGDRKGDANDEAGRCRGIVSAPAKEKVKEK
jgi:hypothetical protein